MNLKEIEQRLAAIQEELKDDAADVEALKAETETLIEQRAALVKKNEDRAELLKNIADQNLGVGIRGFKDDAERDRVLEGYATEEYRSAFLKNLLGLQLDEAEERAYLHTTENTGAVIPKELQNKIYSTMEEAHPLLTDVTRVASGTVLSIVKHVSIDEGDAKNVAEGEANVDEKNTFVNVELAGQDISKHIEFSYRLGKMAIPAFEAYLVKEIGDRIGSQWAKNIYAQIESDLAADNKVTAKTAGTLALEDFMSAFAKLKAVTKVVVYANNETSWANIFSMKDTDRKISYIPDYHNQVAGQVLGKPIKEEDAVPTGKVLVLDPTQYIENVVQDLLIERDRDIKKHVHTIAGIVISGGTLTNDKAGAVITVGTAG